MSYGLPSSGEYAAGTSPSQSLFEKIVDSISFLAGLTKGDTTLSTLSASTELQDPDYDSGWFAVSASTLYTKPHGLTLNSVAARPRQVVVWFSTSASPADSVDVQDVSNSPISTHWLWVSDTNIKVRTNTAVGYPDPTNIGTNPTSGYYRILAWV